MDRFFCFVFIFTILPLLCLVTEPYHSIFDAVSKLTKRIKAIQDTLKNYSAGENPTPLKLISTSDYTVLNI